MTQSILTLNSERGPALRDVDLEAHVVVVPIRRVVALEAVTTIVEVIVGPVRR